MKNRPTRAGHSHSGAPFTLLPSEAKRSWGDVRVIADGGVMSNETEAHDPSAPYDGAPAQRSWGGKVDGVSICECPAYVRGVAYSM
jgi:hypothetical protein